MQQESIAKGAKERKANTLVADELKKSDLIKGLADSLYDLKGEPAERSRLEGRVEKKKAERDQQQELIAVN